MAAAPELSAELLSAPASHAVRAIAAARLADVRDALGRLSSGDDETLHALRVALRRLRTWLRAYRPQLEDTVKKKAYQRLTGIADATGSARDAEVALDWITAMHDLAPREKPGARYAAELLRAEGERARAAARKAVGADLPDVLETLEKQLGSYWLRHRLATPQRVPGMAAVSRHVLEQHADRFGQALRRIKGSSDIRGVHRARIAAKRLRYLLETLDPGSGADKLVAGLSDLQDMLGVAHDGNRVTEHLLGIVGATAKLDARRAASPDVAAQAAAAPRFSRVRPGLVALADRAEQGGRSGFDAFRRHWRKRQLSSAVNSVKSVARSLGD